MKSIERRIEVLEKQVGGQEDPPDLVINFIGVDAEGNGYEIPEMQITLHPERWGG